MKKSVAITAVLSLHVAVIGLLLAQAGCSSESSAPQVPEAKMTVSEPEQIKTSSPEVNEAMRERDEVILPPEGSRALRADPTRPAPDQEKLRQEEEKTQLNDPLSESSATAAKASDSGMIPPKSPASPEEKLATYVVVKGDSAELIARKHKVRTSDLLSVNGLDRNSILKIGQELKIPANGIMQPQTASRADSVSVNSSLDTEIYVVARGDTLSRIAQRRGMTVRQIMSINGLKSHKIMVGQKLRLAKVSAAQQAASNAGKPQSQTDAAAGEISHTVLPGETLGAIAIKYGSSVKAIAERNKIADPRKIRAGQVLLIKSSKAAATAKPQTNAPAEKPAEKAPEQPTINVQSDASVQAAPAPSAPSAATSPAVPSATSPAPGAATPSQGSAPSASAPQGAPVNAPENENVPIQTF